MITCDLPPEPPAYCAEILGPAISEPVTPVILGPAVTVPIEPVILGPAISDLQLPTLPVKSAPVYLGPLTSVTVRMSPYGYV